MNKLVKSKRLTELEGKALIGLGLAKTGMADAYESIKTIKDEKLYKETHKNFSSYIEEVFKFTVATFHKTRAHIEGLKKISGIILPTQTQWHELSLNPEKRARTWDAIIEHVETEELDPSTLDRKDIKKIAKTIDITPEGMVVKLPEMPKLPAVLNNYDVQNTESEVGNIIYNISTAINFFDVRPQEFRDWLNGYANFLEAKEAQNG